MLQQRLECRLKPLRQARGLGQADLAAAVGLTRQAIGAIESGSYVPNTAVALQLARILDMPVEALFVLHDAAPVLPLARLAGPASGRVGVAQVRDALVGFPLGGAAQERAAFAGTDALLDPAGRAVHLLFPAERLERTAVLMGCDPALALLSELVAERGDDTRVAWRFAPSQPSLDALAAGEVHLAGTHLVDVTTGESDLAPARAALATTGGVVVAFASWAQGLMVARGNPHHLHTIVDLAEPEVRFINREPGSGSRTVMDALLRRAGIAASAVNGYRTLASSHLDGARAVAGGTADAAIGLETIAVACGLDFIPLVTVRCDLVVPADLRSHPAVAAVFDVLASADLRTRLAALPGYEVSATGSVVAEVPAPVKG